MTHTFSISETHPALSGHFPGRALVPGVVILQRVIKAATKAGYRITGLAQVKFSAPLLPKESAFISFEGNDDRLQFTVQHRGETLAKGSLSLERAET